jgi:hypothetical protein
MRRLITTGALFTAVALAAATGAGAAVSPSYQVGGIAFGAPQSTTTNFFGNSIGSTGDRASWQASVSRAALSATAAVGSSSAVTGGTFGLRSNNGSQLTGTFTGGSLVLTAAAPGCGRQTFALSSSLALADGGTATFQATLTTFRFQFRGTCTTLLSTVQGTLTPSAAPPPPPPPGDGTGDL